MLRVCLLLLVLCLPAFAPVVAQGICGPRIAWDYGSVRRLAHRGGYPRVLPLHDGTLAAVFEDHSDGTYSLRRSADGGDTWTAPEKVFHPFEVENEGGKARIHIANSELLQLSTGELLAACNYRPSVPEITPFAIAVCRSTDNGHTWSRPQVIYEAGPRFTDGCWESCFLELPDGDVQVYFANEGPYTRSSEQQISVLMSHDKGLTWGDFRTVCFRKDSRDGMPVARVVGSEIVCAIEDCGFTAFKPYTVRTTLEDNWASPVLFDSPRREKALAEAVNDSVYMGAPYLAVLPTGETLLSYQADTLPRLRPGDRVPYSVMEVAVGDREARHFTLRTRPFPIRDDQHAGWPSVSVLDANTVAALASVDTAGVYDAPRFMKGHVLRDFTVTDMVADFPHLFIGHKGLASLRAGMTKDDRCLYITCHVRNVSGSGAEASFYIDTKGGTDTSLSPDIYKLRCTSAGQLSVWQNRNGEWVQGRWDGASAMATPTADGSELRITLPLRPGDSRTSMRVAALLRTAAYNEWLVHAEETRPDTWLRMTFR